MANPIPSPADPTTPLDAALDALKTYDHGAGRGVLVPIDDAVAASLPDPTARLQLERRLLSTLARSPSPVAKEYLCSKLALLGSAQALPTLAPLLDDPQVATAARNALEHIPDPAADQTLRERLVKLHGPARIGVIHSLGARRSTSSVRLLTRQLKGPHADIAAAAAAALGDIDSPGAARALRSFFPKAAPQLRPALSDALLACAERSAGEGNPAEARSLYQLLLASPGPKHVQSAASQGLARCAVAP